MITFAIGLFIGAFIGFILAAILAMSKDFDEYARKKHYRRGLGSGADLCEGRLELLGSRGSSIVFQRFGGS